MDFEIDVIQRNILKKEIKEIKRKNKVNDNFHLIVYKI